TVNGMTNSAQGVNTSASNVENQTVFPPVNDISNMMGTNQTEGSPPLTQAQLGSDVNVVPKRKSKSKKIFLSTVIVIILLVAGYISWNLFVTFTPLQLFTKAIDTLQGTINEFYSYGSVSGNVNINFDSDANENYNLFATYASDFKDKILTSSFDFKYENTDVIKGNVYYLDNKLYVEAKELYSQVPYFESDADFSVTIDNYVANYKVLCQEYLEAFKASMRDDMISYKKSNDLDVYTFVIDDSNYLEFWTSVFNYLKSDQKFIDAYQSIFVDDNAIDFLDGCIDDLSFDKKKMTISLYLKSRSLSQISITSNMNEYDIMELNLTDIKGSNFNYTIKYGDDYVFNGSFARNDNTDVFKLAFKIDYNGSVELEIVNNYNVEVVAPKIENAINYENISDEDKQIIYQRAQELILDL
ncbi:MAG: hypothetical protein Q4G04_04215, partial [bacterium]|nr:hypothetical protein [bacterium]